MTQQQIQLSRKYLTYKLLTNLWFVGAIWLYFYRLYITDQQVGVLDGIAFAIGLVAEVPSGVLADKFGRDRMVKLGQILTGSGLLIQALGTSFAQLLIGQAIVMIGVSFVSGADEALFFDKLEFKKTAPDWRKLVTRGSQFALLGSTAGMIIGGWLHTIDARLPWYLNAFAFICAAVVIWPMTEQRQIKNKISLIAELKEYFGSIQTGFMQFATNTFLMYVPMIVIVQGLFYAAGWGLLRMVLLDRFHFNPFVGSMVVATCSLITVAILSFMHKYADNLSEKRVLTFISISASVSLLLSIADIGNWGFFVMLALYAGEHVLHPFMSEIINYRAASEQRATLLSVSSFMRTLPYVLMAPLIGSLSAQNKMEYFFVTWSLLIGGAIMLYLTLKKQDSHIHLTEKV